MGEEAGSAATGIAVSTTSQSTSVTTGATCKLIVDFCRVRSPYGYSSSFRVPTTATLPLPENLELKVGECSPDGRGGAYKVSLPVEDPAIVPGGCPVPQQFMQVYVDHYPEESCTSVPSPRYSKPSFTVWTSGDCGGRCCDIRTGVCNFGCGGRFSRA